MASLLSNLMRAQIELLNPLLMRMDVKAQRKLQDGLGKLGVKLMTEDVNYRDEFFENFEASWAEPADARKGKAILYLHGGAYTAGTLAYARCFGGVLAQTTGLRTLCVGYRLAPEHPYPAALEDALAAYRRMTARYAPKDIVVAGESAGGGLCFCLCLKLRELGLEQPARVVALSPWANLKMDGDYAAEIERDPVLSVENLRFSAQMYAGENVALPCVSPICGDLRGLPPTLILAGTDEILLDDARRMTRRLRESGVRCELSVAQDMWHVYEVYGIPEAKEALERIRVFLAEA